MDTHPRKMLVVIAESALEKRLVRDARSCGAHGYTIADVRGGGTGGDREARWEADRSIEMKVVCEAEVAQRLAEHLIATYGEHYGLTLFVSEVGVFRPGKF